MSIKIQNQKKLEQLAQQMFNRGREEIENEIRSKLKQIIEKFSANGILYSGRFLQETIKLHTERIERFLKLRLNIDKEMFSNNQPVKKDDDVNFIMKNLEKIARHQKFIMLSDSARIIDRHKGNEHFKQSMERNIVVILSKVKRDLNIEKDKFALVRRKEIEQVGLKTEEVQNFDALVKSIENDSLREILQRDFENTVFCLKNELWKPCVVLCGGILEGVFNIEFGMDKTTKSGKSTEMRLEDMIDEAKNIGILPKKHDADLAHAVRAFRNYVHIKREIKDDHSIDDTDAHISINVVKKIFRMIEKYKTDQKKALLVAS